MGEEGVNKVQYGLCEIGELACKQALLFEHQRSEPRENARASGEASRGFSRVPLARLLFTGEYLTIFPRARMGSESTADEAEGLMGYLLRGHEGERNNCFSKIQLVSQKYREKKV